jgi:hypothetical protein
MQYEKGDQVNDGRYNFTFLEYGSDGRPVVLNWAFGMEGKKTERWVVDPATLRDGWLTSRRDGPTLNFVAPAKPKGLNDPYELALHVAKNWQKITGLPKSAMHEEGEFPEAVEKLCAAYNVDLTDFSDAWNEVHS